jgi:hypothetical protein
MLPISVPDAESVAVARFGLNDSVGRSLLGDCHPEMIKLGG